ncbi:MAG: glycosyltransferase family 2 protein [Deltaproteobacteria bacterium]|nr:glycosyltransferase family 2 protein [Deltaproteobacteria bacterium]
MWDSLRVAVVIPAFDEEMHLPGVLDGVPSWVDDVIVVDDASGDRTWAIASAAGGRVQVHRHAHNRGVGAALVTGYRAALAGGADVVAVMAGDGQMRPEELASLIAPVASARCDYCKGDRTAHPEVGARMPRWRRLGGAVLSVWTRRLGGLDQLRDAQCGFTAISAAALERIPLARLYPRYGYPNDLLVMLGTVGARVLEVPVTPVYDGQASGIRPGRAVLSHSYVLGRAWWWRRGFLAARRERAPWLLSEATDEEA